MKIITVNLPESHVRLIEEIGSRTSASRSELLRVAIKQFLIKELAYVQKLEKELEKARKTHIFDYCINCEKKLEILVGKNHVIHQAYEICGLKFCALCYKKFKDKALGEFPPYLIAQIKKKIQAYKDFIENSNIEKIAKDTTLIQKLENEFEKIKKTHLFEYCINCESKLNKVTGKYHEVHKNYEICGLKFCYICYEKFKDKALGEFPTNLVASIKKKIEAFKDYVANSNINKVTMKETVFVQKLELKLEKLKISHFFDYCINCERKLHRLAEKNHRFQKNIEIFELKFCCSCYNKFKNKTLDEFPVDIINRIKKKVKAYKSYKEQSDKSNLTY